MKHRTEGNRLYLKIEQNLNLITARCVEKLAEPAREIFLDLSDARIVDSEGVILLYRLLRSGKEVYLSQPPAILGEIIQALELEEVIPLDRLITDAFVV